MAYLSKKLSWVVLKGHIIPATFSSGFFGWTYCKSRSQLVKVTTDISSPNLL